MLLSDEIKEKIRILDCKTQYKESYELKVYLPKIEQLEYEKQEFIKKSKDVIIQYNKYRKIEEIHFIHELGISFYNLQLLLEKTLNKSWEEISKEI